jgi:4-amino-4-deoxy-L-arabinose transferase-like glycosyltransferase
MISEAPPPTPTYGADLWRLALGVAILFFALLASRPLATPDEGRYTEIPREMLVSGDWVTPRLNGVKYFEKPPLVYWLTAASLKVLGVNEVAARFWSAALALGGVLLTYAAGRALYGRSTGWLAAGVLATSLLYYGLSQILTLDMAVSVFVAAALFAFLLAVRSPPGSRRRWLFWGFYAAMALATLTKGLIGIVLPCAVAGLWVLVVGKWRQLRPFHPFSGTLVLLLIAAPWHVLAARANPDFLYFYFVHEHFLRFTTKLHSRFEPWWFFIPVLVGGLFPWSAFLLQSVRMGLADGAASLSRSWRDRERNEAAWFLLVWIGFIVLFFSRSQSKLIPYILPVFPAAAVLIGRYLAAAWAAPEERRLRRALTGVSVLAGVMGVAALFLRVDRDPTMATDLHGAQVALAALFVIGAFGVAWLVWRRGCRQGLVGLLAWTIILLASLNPIYALADRRTARALALELAPRLQPGDEIFSVGDYLQDVPVYLGRTIGVVGFEGELDFGIHAEPERAAGRFLTVDELVVRWQTPGRRFAFGYNRKVASLLARPDFPHVIVGRHRGQILFSNQIP